MAEGVRSNAQQVGRLCTLRQQQQLRIVTASLTCERRPALLLACLVCQLWKEVVGEDGRSLVGAYGSYFCTYYLEAAATEDQAVREAAAHSIAELATKIDKDAITPYLPQLLSALLVCLEVSPPPLPPLYLSDMSCD